MFEIVDVDAVAVMAEMGGSVVLVGYGSSYISFPLSVRWIECVLAKTTPKVSLGI